MKLLQTKKKRKIEIRIIQVVVDNFLFFFVKQDEIMNIITSTYGYLSPKKEKMKEKLKELRRHHR